MDHLKAMDELRQGIGLRAYGQRNPLVEYKMESFNMFREMSASIREDIIKYLFALKVVREDKSEDRRNLNYTHGPLTTAYDTAQGRGRSNAGGEEEKLTPIVKEDEPGRNDPCPCGSGRKYKRCCINK